jgi:hypothetical protein
MAAGEACRHLDMSCERCNSQDDYRRWQDLVELETAVKLKEGVERSPKRVATTQKRFASAIEGFDKFLAYFK